MLGLFKNKKPRFRQDYGEARQNQMSPKDLNATIAELQKQLDALKAVAKMKSAVGPEQIVVDAMNEIRERAESLRVTGKEKVVEGVFDGQNMVGADGAVYDVPANYASKSKLVEGDILKLTINNLGAFIYKQIKPIERTRLRGVLSQDSRDFQYYAEADDKKWRLLTASVTYYKGEPGDEVVFLIPADGGSRWAAVENIVKG